MDRAELESEILQLLINKYKKYERDCVAFIKEAVKIEDRDSEELAIPFNLWDKQKEALDTILNNRLTVIMKARQLGLTWLVLSYAVWRMVFKQGYSVVALSKREDPDAKELIRRIEFILRHLPFWLIREKKTAPPDWDGLTWESTVLSITIYHPDGESSVFRSMTAAPDSGRSFTANLVILDEWAYQMWADEIWSAAYPTINRPTGGQVIGISTNRRGTLFEQILREAIRGVNGFAYVFLPWFTDPRRDEAWYEATKKALPNNYLQEYPATIEEAFSAGEGTAFPEFSREIHVCEPFEIPSWWKRWRSNDPGYTDPFFWHWFAVGDDGHVYVYREYTRDHLEAKIPYSEQAKRVTAMSKMKVDGKQVDEDIAFTVTGRDAFSRHPETGKSIVDYYFEGGVRRCIEPPRDRTTDRIHRKAILHEYLKPYLDENTGKMTAKLQIFRTCHGLIESLPLLVVDEHNPEKVAESAHDHAYDSVGMGLQVWHATGSRRPEERKKSIIAEHKDRLARRSVRRRARLL